VRKSFGPIDAAQGVALAELTKTILRPYCAPHVEGATVRLGEHATNSIALILHELATNAAKYGALSVDHGEIIVAWDVDQDVLRLRWREENGPEIRQPTEKGFGSTLIERTIAAHGGTLKHVWFPRGLAVHIDIPMDELAR